MNHIKEYKYDNRVRDLMYTERVLEYFSKLIENKYDKNQEVPKFTDLLSPSYVKPSNNTNGFRLLDSVNGSSVRGYYSFDHKAFISNYKDYEQIVVVHHIDMDGELSSSNLSHLFKFIFNNTPIFIRYNYSKDEPIRNSIMKKTKMGSKILIVISDLSIPSVILQDLSIFGDILILDHHATSIDFVSNIDQSKLDNKVEWIIDTRFSAAYLTEVFNNYIMDKLFNIDKCTEYGYSNTLLLSFIVSCYDTFNKSDEVEECFTCGLYLNQYFNDMGLMTSSTDYWSNLRNSTEDELMDIILTGCKFYELQQKKNNLMYLNDYKYYYKYKDTCITFLSGYGNSTRFYVYKSDVMGLIRVDEDETYTISLYSEDPNIRSFGLGKFLSEYFDGGGHPGAAGCSVTFSMVAGIFASYCRDHGDEEIFNKVCEANIIVPRKKEHVRFDTRLAFITRAISMMILNELYCNHLEE